MDRIPSTKASEKIDGVKASIVVTPPCRTAGPMSTNVALALFVLDALNIMNVCTMCAEKSTLRPIALIIKMLETVSILTPR